VEVGGEASGIGQTTIGPTGYAQISLIKRRNNQDLPGTYDVKVYAYTDIQGSNITCERLDISVLGNLP
jgi:hypothetical protein